MRDASLREPNFDRLEIEIRNEAVGWRARKLEA